jgi:hypothetical protein
LTPWQPGISICPVIRGCRSKPLAAFWRKGDAFRLGAGMPDRRRMRPFAAGRPAWRPNHRGLLLRQDVLPAPGLTVAEAAEVARSPTLRAA